MNCSQTNERQCWLLDISIYKKDIENHKVFVYSLSPSFWCALFFSAVAFHQKIWALHQTLIKREWVFLLKSILVALIFLQETVEARRLAKLHAQAIKLFFSMLVKTDLIQQNYELQTNLPSLHWSLVVVYYSFEADIRIRCLAVVYLCQSPTQV